MKFNTSYLEDLICYNQQIKILYADALIVTELICLGLMERGELNTAYPLPLDTTYPVLCPIQRIQSNRLIPLKLTRGCQGEFKKIKDIKVEDDSLACDSPLEVSTVKSSIKQTDDESYSHMKVEIANLPIVINRVMNIQEHKVEDMGFDTSILHLLNAFNEFNYLLKVYPDLLTKDIMGFKTYDDYKDDWIYEWNKDVPWVDEKPWTDTGVWTEPKHYEWYKALEDGELKDEALRNKAFREGSIKDDDDESSYEQMRR
ncbi:hypothetical protein Tco_0237484 [Tanacetum coccineum]